MDSSSSICRQLAKAFTLIFQVRFDNRQEDIIQQNVYATLWKRIKRVTRKLHGAHREARSMFHSFSLLVRDAREPPRLITLIRTRSLITRGRINIGNGRNLKRGLNYRGNLWKRQVTRVTRFAGSHREPDHRFLINPSVPPASA